MRCGENFTSFSGRDVGLSYDSQSSSETFLSFKRNLLLLGKVFSKLGLSVPEDLLQGVVASKPGVIEYILNVLKGRVSISMATIFFLSLLQEASSGVVIKFP